MSVISASSLVGANLNVNFTVQTNMVSCHANIPHTKILAIETLAAQTWSLYWE